jgi:type VI secretion system secreted protein Hcp
MNFEHYFDTSSTVILGYICTGKAFPKVELQITKSTGGSQPETFFTMTMEGAFIIKVGNSGDEEGNVVQRVEMVFKTVKIEYKPHQSPSGQLGAAKIYTWDIPAGTASPSA